MASKLRLAMVRLLIASLVFVIVFGGVGLAQDNNAIGQYCGGIQGVQCPTGYTCNYDTNAQDSNGACITACTEHTTNTCTIQQGRHAVLTVKTLSNCDTVSSGSYCEFDCVDGACTQNPQVTEGIRCVFNNSTAVQNCSFKVLNEQGQLVPYSMLNTCESGGGSDNTCALTVSGQKGYKLYWTGCGPSAPTTILDGTDKNVSFDCPQAVSEEVKCVFIGSTTQQKCDSIFGTCSGVYDCRAQLTNRPKGTTVQWESTCAGNPSTFMDGVSEEIRFDCGNAGCTCTTEYAPVCGANGKTYSNRCNAECENVAVAYEGECRATHAGIPLCLALGSRSEGWYDSVTKSLFKWDNCRNCAAQYAQAMCKCATSDCVCPVSWLNSCTGGEIAAAPKERPSCTLEGQTMAVYPGNACCIGLTAIPTTSTVPTTTAASSSTASGTITSANPSTGSAYGSGQSPATGNILAITSISSVAPAATSTVNTQIITNAIAVPQPTSATTVSSDSTSASPTCQALVGASICSQCGNGNCEPWENQCNCPRDCGGIIPQEKKYRYAKWTCSDGTTHLEGGPTSCKTEQTWKEYARRSCGDICHSPESVKEQVKCVFYNVPGPQKCYSDDQKFGCVTQNAAASPVAEAACIADVYGEKGSTVTWKSTCGGYSYTTIDGSNEYAKFDCSNASTTTPSASGGASPATGQLTATASSTQQTASADASTSTAVPVAYSSENCVQGYVTDFSVSEECQDSGLACRVQAYDEIKAIKEQCAASNGKILVTKDSDGCPYYSCEATSTTCVKAESLPEDQYSNCADVNGEFVVKTDDQGCITFMACVGSTTPQRPVKVPDKVKLLELALKLENLKVEFDKLISKVQALADYYSGKGDTNSVDKFTRAVAVLESAKLKIDEIKNFIRTNVDSFDEAKAQQVRDDVVALREDMLSEVLMILLE